MQGAPVNIKDFKLLLDQRVYERFEGKWQDLLSRVKWDTVRSVVKSATGLQRGKFKVGRFDLISSEMPPSQPPSSLAHCSGTYP